MRNVYIWGMKKKESIHYPIISPSEYAALIGKSPRWVQMKCKEVGKAGILYIILDWPELPGVRYIGRINNNWAITMEVNYIRTIKTWHDKRKAVSEK